MKSAVQNRNNRVLVIDGDRLIHDRIRRMLGSHVCPTAEFTELKTLLFGETRGEPGDSEFEVDSAFHGEEGYWKVHAAGMAGSPFAVAFVDLGVRPGWEGLDTLARIWEQHPDLQVVLCASESEQPWPDFAGRFGRNTNLIVLRKPFEPLEVRQLADTLAEKWSLSNVAKGQQSQTSKVMDSQRATDLQIANEALKAEIADRMEIEKALRLSEERFSKAFKASPVPLAIQSLKDLTYLDANQEFLGLTGFAREELINRGAAELKLWSGSQEGSDFLEKLAAQEPIRNLPCKLRTKSGQMRDILISVELFELGGETCFLTIARDLTEQTLLETQLRQSQKMEAVGQLAAGVAHDFNNLLTVVKGYSTLLLSKEPQSSPKHKPLQTISAAADRASTLVRQLLTFSRKQVMQVRLVNVHSTLSAMADMLPRLIGEHLTVRIIAPPDLPPINADASMMEQMLVNLAVNARDAMSEGGRLTISAEIVELSSEAARINQEARPGQFMCITVSDNGCGIAPENLPRIFEPFFTTKPVGKGTGLGLATVYGIAKQHNGWIEVKSQVGQGTSFMIFLPVDASKSEKPAVPVTPQLVKGGSESILVVEDDGMVRDFVVQVLAANGYKVLAAVSGVQALEQWYRRKERIDLLLTDMVMPGGLLGRELAERLVAEDPALMVIYTSGYSPGLAGRELALLEGRNFLPKPYGPAKLLQAVRDCLDSRSDCDPEPTEAAAVLA